MLAGLIGWDPCSLEASIVKDWQDRVAECRANLLQALDSGPAGREAWNQEAALLCRQLISQLGKERAEWIAVRIPVHRVDPSTGEVRRTDLEGRPIGQDQVEE